MPKALMLRLLNLPGRRLQCFQDSGLMLRTSHSEFGKRFIWFSGTSPPGPTIGTAKQ